MSNDQSRKKDTDKLRGRFNLDYIYQETEDPQATMNATLALSLTEEPFNPALRRLEALRKELSVDALSMGLSPIDIDKANWVEVGPIAITNGQTYGGADVIITGRVTAICPHPSDPNTIYLGSSRGGIWKTTDSGTNWYPMSDHSESLAIGYLDI